MSPAVVALLAVHAALPAPLVEVRDGGHVQLGRGPVTLVFERAVEPAALLGRIRAHDATGADVALRLARPPPVAERTRREQLRLVAVSLSAPPPDGTRVTLEVDAPDGALPLRREYTVATHFALVVAPPPTERAPLALELRLQPTTPLNLARLERALRLSPVPRSLEVRASATGDAVVVSAALAPGRDYRLRLPAGLTDALGNRLAAPLDLRFRTRNLGVSLRTSPGPLVLARGAAALPLEAVNVAAVRAELHAFDSPARFATALALGERPTCAALGADAELEASVGAAIGGRLDRAMSRSLELPPEGAAEEGAGAGDATPAAPRALCVELFARGRGSEAQAAERLTAALVQVSDLGVSAQAFPERLLVWTEHLADGRPLDGVRVSLVGFDGAELAAAVSGSDGIALLPTPAPGRAAFLVARRGADQTIALLPPARRAAEGRDAPGM